MPTGKNPQQHESHEGGFLLLFEFRKECLLSQLIHAGELAKHCFRELVSDVVGYADHADDLSPDTPSQLGKRLGTIPLLYLYILYFCRMLRTCTSIPGGLRPISKKTKA